MPMSKAIKCRETKLFFFSYGELKSRVEDEKKSTGESELDIIKKKSSIDNEVFDVFISYSYLDDPVIPIALSLLLRDNGCSSYLPERIDRNSGYIPSLGDINKTRFVLKNSKSLIMVNGPKTSRSQWIPWEIGFISGSTGKVAVSSTAEKEDKVKNREFLRLYPSVINVSGGLRIGDYQESGIPIREWVEWP